MTTRKPILVTGSHRSGSTWVGKMIAKSPSVSYIHEPFNGMCRPGICSAKFPYTFMYITEENESNFYEPIKKAITYRYDISAEMQRIKTFRDIARLLRDYLICSKNGLFGVTPLVKDPMAILSSEWLANKFDMNVLILIRHPAAFISSCKQLGWGFNFVHFLKQPLLMRDYLYPFETEILKNTSQDTDLIDKCILLWRTLYYVVIQYQKKYPDWTFYRYEDLCKDPLECFNKLFQKFELDFSPDIKNIIQEYTDSSNKKGNNLGIHSIKRDSISHVWIWKERLTKSEIEYIREKVEDISKYFYSDSDW